MSFTCFIPSAAMRLISARLSAACIQTKKLRGGPMSQTEIVAFETSHYAEMIERLLA
jgi:hypothetical protein